MPPPDPEEDDWPGVCVALEGLLFVCVFFSRLSPPPFFKHAKPVLCIGTPALPLNIENGC
jgi:hypothetical protein